MPETTTSSNVDDTTSTTTTSSGDASSPNTSSPTLTYYPAYCYSASPTWFKWVKLTCHDFHYTLHTGPSATTTRTTYTSAGGSGPNAINNTVHFYLNHPIQYIQLVGIVVAIEDYETFSLFTLDDSSGATVDVVLRKPKPPPPVAKVPLTLPAPQQRQQQQQQQDHRTTPSDADLTEEAIQTAALLTLIPTLVIGTPLLAKGTPTTFRNTRQLHPLRLTVLPNTTSELRLVASRTAFYTITLSTPWVVEPAKQRTLLEVAQADITKRGGRERKKRERKRKLREWEREREGWTERVLEEEWIVEEGQRAQDAERMRADGVEVMARRRRKIIEKGANHSSSNKGEGGAAGPALAETDQQQQQTTASSG